MVELAPDSARAPLEDRPAAPDRDRCLQPAPHGQAQTAGAIRLKSKWGPKSAPNQRLTSTIALSEP